MFLRVALGSLCKPAQGARTALLLSSSAHMGLVQILPKILSMHVCLQCDARRAKLIQHVRRFGQDSVHVWDGQQGKKAKPLGSKVIHLGGQQQPHGFRFQASRKCMPQ